MQKTERILVLVSGMFGLGLRVLLRKSGLVPALHCNFGVVRRGQSFFGANGGYPLVGRLLIGLL